MTNHEAVNQLSDTPLQSLYDYHFSNDGAGYRLPIMMLKADPNSKMAIDGLIENGYATDSGQGTVSLVYAITEKGLDAIKKITVVSRGKKNVLIVSVLFVILKTSKSQGNYSGFSFDMMNYHKDDVPKNVSM